MTVATVTASITYFNKYLTLVSFPRLILYWLTGALCQTRMRVSWA